MPKGMNKAAYQSSLSCPTCTSKAIRRVEAVGPYMTRYRCRKCGLPFLYDIAPERVRKNPYAGLGEKFLRKIRQNA